MAAAAWPGANRYGYKAVLTGTGGTRCFDLRLFAMKHGLVHPVLDAGAMRAGSSTSGMPCSITSLDASTHCPFHLLVLLEEARIGPIHLDSQALPASGAHVDGLELAALYRLQHLLAGHAEGEGGLQHGQPAGRGLLNELGPQVVGDADAPRVNCSPAMKPSPSQRCTVDGATPRILAASTMVTSSPSGSSVAGW